MVRRRARRRLVLLEPRRRLRPRRRRVGAQRRPRRRAAARARRRSGAGRLLLRNCSIRDLPLGSPVQALQRRRTAVHAAPVDESLDRRPLRRLRRGVRGGLRRAVLRRRASPGVGRLPRRERGRRALLAAAAAGRRRGLQVVQGRRRGRRGRRRARRPRPRPRRGRRLLLLLPPPQAATRRREAPRGRPQGRGVARPGPVGPHPRIKMTHRLRAPQN
mmetsp:Transcript_12173/g.41524  ORF Transcript_12173/g.41524 Transcript_12173/m.41524 type:complete len:217 (-) Transcript_12173:6-656(-)